MVSESSGCSALDCSLTARWSAHYLTKAAVFSTYSSFCCIVRLQKLPNVASFLNRRKLHFHGSRAIQAHPSGNGDTDRQGKTSFRVEYGTPSCPNNPSTNLRRRRRCAESLYHYCFTDHCTLSSCRAAVLDLGLALGLVTGLDRLDWLLEREMALGRREVEIGS